VVKCRNRSGSASVTLCAGTVSNSHITVERVTLWDDISNRCLYCGPLQNKELWKSLTKARVCGGELTKASTMDSAGGKLCCYGEFETCQVADCPFKCMPRRRLKGMN
jgi:hypothetical protein